MPAEAPRVGRRCDEDVAHVVWLPQVQGEADAVVLLQVVDRLVEDETQPLTVLLVVEVQPADPQEAVHAVSIREVQLVPVDDARTVKDQADRLQVHQVQVLRSESGGEARVDVEDVAGHRESSILRGLGLGADP